MSVLDHLDAVDAALLAIKKAAGRGEDVRPLVDDARMLLVGARSLLERDPTGKFQKLED
jgi:hypothetical protein